MLGFSFGRGKRTRRSPWRVAAILGLSLTGILSAAAQVPNSPSDPLAQEILQALQQRNAQPADTTQLQPNTQIRTSPTYPPEPQLPQGSVTLPPNPAVGGPIDLRFLSSLERV